jgi:hypothetical protein
MGPIGCPETSANDYHSTLRNTWTLEYGTDRLSRNVGKGYHSTLRNTLTLEDGTDRLSRNVGKGLPFDAS